MTQKIQNLNIQKITIIPKKVKENNIIFLSSYFIYNFYLENSFDSIENRKSLYENHNNLMPECINNNNLKEKENNERRFSGNLNDSLNRRKLSYSSSDENFDKKKFYSNLYNQYIYEFRDEVFNFKENKENEIVDILRKFFNYKYQLLNDVNSHENNNFKFEYKQII